MYWAPQKIRKKQLSISLSENNKLMVGTWHITWKTLVKQWSVDQIFRAFMNDFVTQPNVSKSRFFTCDLIGIKSWIHSFSDPKQPTVFINVCLLSWCFFFWNPTCKKLGKDSESFNETCVFARNSKTSFIQFIQSIAEMNLTWMYPHT